MKPTLMTVMLLFATISTAHAPGGLQVDSVNPGGPAATAGIRAGDHIIGLAGEDIGSLDDLNDVIVTKRPGDTVKVMVRRDGETIDLSLTFGERPDGGASMGVMLRIVEEGAESEQATADCLEWIETTYRVETTIRDLGLDLTDAYRTLRACVEHDTRRMTPENAVKYCDNIFKVHCSGLDLLAEIGEAQVARCESGLGASLGLALERHKAWKTCASHRVFDGYSMAGDPIDEATCKAALLEECGSNLDAAAEAGTVSPGQRAFLTCCSADALDSSRSGSCSMIDDGFTRGPCHDRPVCVDRLTGDWIHCSALD